ncbi:MAG: L-threonylcarbamoyladenylate synthase [Bacteroidota bacterium]|nr:L-threonylcarbamoyladenylate synthase [Bacteroidota bacterium]
MIDTEVQIAAEVILSGGIILYPTDTIWGIGCDATKQETVQNIYRIKQRDDRKSMLVLVNGISMLEKYVDVIPPRAFELIQEAVKPTTIIYPGARNLASNLIASDGSIGIRITSDPFCKQLIKTTGLPIVSTSANVSGEQSPGTFHQILLSLREQVGYVVNWRQDETAVSTPSAVIKLEVDGSITIIRS